MHICYIFKGEFITIGDRIDSAVWKSFHVTGDQLIMAEKEVILTHEGLKKLEDELDTLKSVKRREIAERIKVAIGYGDISENSEYEDAKNEQAFVEGRVMTLEKMLRNARIINSDEVDTNTVSIGSIVTLKDLEVGELVEYSIVGTAESDPLHNKISNESPVGRAILGKKKGVSVDINVPAGTITYQIIDIKK
jgi:transcription elongation factor GreA